MNMWPKNIGNESNVNLQDYGYVSLEQDETQNLIKSVARLMDEVFETPDRDFQDYFAECAATCEIDPVSVFKTVFDSIRDVEMTKYQRKFFELLEVNINSSFRWYKRNNCAVNLSPKQTEWFDRWFDKYDIGHETLRAKQPGYSRSIKPVFKRGAR